jgi:microcystin-dependent protein
LHTHTFSGTSNAANDKQPTAGTALAISTKAGPISPADNYYAADSNSLQPLNPNSVSLYGSSQPHANLQPYLTINWCIAMQGIYPSRN